MQMSIVFHREFHLDDAFWEIVVAVDIVEVAVGVEGVNELNEVEAVVAVHDTSNAVMEPQMVDRYSLDYHQLFRNDMQSKVN